MCISHYRTFTHIVTVMRLVPLYGEGGMVGNQVSRAMRGKIITTATGALRHPTTHLSTRHQRRGREWVAQRPGGGPSLTSPRSH